MTNTRTQWYGTNANMYQGIIADADTGRTVAVTYDRKDTPLVAQAPAMLESLKIIAGLADNDAGMATDSILRLIRAEAEGAIYATEGGE